MAGGLGRCWQLAGQTASTRWVIVVECLSRMHGLREPRPPVELSRRSSPAAGAKP
jgi:hypothetical protein